MIAVLAAMIMLGPRSLLLAALLTSTVKALETVSSPPSDLSTLSWEQLQAKVPRPAPTKEQERELQEMQEIMDEADETLSEARLAEEFLGKFDEYSFGIKSFADNYTSEIAEGWETVKAFKQALQDPELSEEVKPMVALVEALENAYASLQDAWLTFLVSDNARHPKGGQELEAAREAVKECGRQTLEASKRVRKAQAQLEELLEEVEELEPLAENSQFLAKEENFKGLETAIRGAKPLSFTQKAVAYVALEQFRKKRDPLYKAISQEIESAKPSGKYADDIIGHLAQLRGLAEKITSDLASHQEQLALLEGDETVAGSMEQLQAVLDDATAAKMAADEKVASLEAEAIPKTAAAAESSEEDEIPEEMRAFAEKLLESAQHIASASEASEEGVEDPRISEAIKARPALSAAMEQVSVRFLLNVTLLM